MKLKNLKDPILDVEGEAITKRTSADDIVASLVKFGVPQDELNGILEFVAGKVKDADVPRTNWTPLEVIKTALQYADAETSFEKRADRMSLAFRLMADPENCDFDKAEITDLKALIAKSFPGPIFSYRMNEVFKAKAE